MPLEAQVSRVKFSVVCTLVCLVALLLCLWVSWIFVMSAGTL